MEYLNVYQTVSRCPFCFASELNGCAHYRGRNDDQALYEQFAPKMEVFAYVRITWGFIVGKQCLWETHCGSYRIVRNEKGFSLMVKRENPPWELLTIAPSLDLALGLCQDRCIERDGEKGIFQNRQEIVLNAQKLGIEILLEKEKNLESRVGEAPSTHDNRIEVDTPFFTENAMKLKVDAVVDLFNETGFHTCEKETIVKDPEKWIGRLGKLPGLLEKMAEEKYPTLSDESTALLAKLEKAVSAETVLEFEGLGEASSNGNGKAKGKAKADKATGKDKAGKGKAKAKDKAEPKEKKESAGTDKFGSRNGSDRAKMNTALSVKPQSAKEIMERAGLERPKVNHLNGLVEKGLLKKDKDGKYSLTKK